MRYLLLSSLCSKEKYQYIYANRNKPMLDSNQKFLASLVRGLCCQKETFVDCISELPISHGCYPKRFLKTEKESQEGINYSYAGCINLPIVRTMTVAFSMYRLARQYVKKYKNEDICVICDILNAEVSFLVNFFKKKKIQTVALVTDIPAIATGMSIKKGLKSFLGSVYGNFTNKIATRYDKYVFLTKQMNDICNPHDKPYMIMECIVDDDLFGDVNVEPYSVPTVVYAGKYYRECGVVTLAQAAPLLKDKCRIVMYGGHGDCDEELKTLENQNDNLEINRIIPLKDVLEIEKKATLLINPRPASEEFTKYSFPSKTAEYMLSATPVLTYKLPGIPDEYDEFLRYIEEESPEGIAASISEVFSYSEEQRKQLGADAREFIKENKNCFVQAKRLIDFMQGV